MTTYTDEEARQQFEMILNAARSQGEVRIKTKDGREYALKPVGVNGSPFEVPGGDLKLTAKEIVSFVREGARTIIAIRIHISKHDKKGPELALWAFCF